VPPRNVFKKLPTSLVAGDMDMAELGVACPFGIRRSESWNIAVEGHFYCFLHMKQLTSQIVNLKV
jgi:hypothetical protein